MTRPQRDDRQRLHRPCPIRQLELEALSDRRQEQHRLELGKGTADAHPLSGAKRQVRSARQALDQSIRPTLRTELLRLVEEARIAMKHPRADQDRGPPGDWLATNLAVAYGLAATPP